MAEITFPQFVWHILSLVSIFSFVCYPWAIVDLN